MVVAFAEAETTAGIGRGHVVVQAREGMLSAEIDGPKVADGIVDYEFVLWRTNAADDPAEPIEFSDALVSYTPDNMIVFSRSERRAVIFAIANPQRRAQAISDIESELRQRGFRFVTFQGYGLAIRSGVSLTSGELATFWAQYAEGKRTCFAPD